MAGLGLSAENTNGYVKIGCISLYKVPTGKVLVTATMITPIGKYQIAARHY